jgi:hypothetical protein
METIVVSTSETAVIATETGSTVVSDNDVVTTIITGLMGPPGATSISKIDDIDFTNLGTGATLVYDTAINKWVATRILDQQIVECGQY